MVACIPLGWSTETWGVRMIHGICVLGPSQFQYASLNARATPRYRDLKDGGYLPAISIAFFESTFSSSKR